MLSVFYHNKNETLKICCLSLSSRLGESPAATDLQPCLSGSARCELREASGAGGAGTGPPELQGQHCLTASSVWGAREAAGCRWPMARPRRVRQQVQANLAPMPMKCHGATPHLHRKEGVGLQTGGPSTSPPCTHHLPEGTVQAHKVVS